MYPQHFRFTTTWWPSSKHLGLGIYFWWGRTGFQIEVQLLIFYMSLDWTSQK